MSLIFKVIKPMQHSALLALVFFLQAYVKMLTGLHNHSNIII